MSITAHKKTLPFARPISLTVCGKTWFIHQTPFKYDRGNEGFNNFRMLKRPSSKAAENEVARRTLRDVEPLSDARTPLAVFFSILLLARSLFLLGWDAQFAQP